VGGNCSAAPLAPFSAGDFCQSLAALGSNKEGSILMVGDSITTQAGFPWKPHLLNSLGQQCSSSSVPFWGTDLHPLPGCSRSLVTVRNDLLSLVNDTVESADSTAIHPGAKPRDFREHPWAHLIAHYNVSLVVLNRGAHYENDTKLLHDVNATISLVGAAHPGLAIVWRNTPFGNVDFHKHVDAKPLHATPPVPPNHPFFYDLFEHQNALVKAFLQRHHRQVLYLDAFTPSVRRLDAHADPLHTCVPGPTDAWLQVLSAALLLVRGFNFSGS